MQFRKIMLSLIGLAAAATVLSSIPAQAQAAGPSVITHAFDVGVGWANSDFTEFVQVEVESTKTGYVLIYNIFDFGGGISAGGSGSIPASSVTVSGGSVNTGKMTLTLNLNACAAGFTNSYGPCGPINLSWVEQPASVGGSIATRGDSQQTFPGGAKVVKNGETVTFFAVTTGTALGYEAPTGATGVLTQETNVTKTITIP